jgi:hypothetical protein
MVLLFHSCFLLVSFTFLVVSLDSLFNLILFSWVCSIVLVVIIVGLKHTNAWFALDLKLWEQHYSISGSKSQDENSTVDMSH